MSFDTLATKAKTLAEQKSKLEIKSVIYKLTAVCF